MATAIEILQFLPAAGMLALAIFMLAMQPRGMKSRSFGVVMFLLAGRLVFQRGASMASSDGNAALSAQMFAIADAYLIALPAALLAFVLACIVRHPAWIIIPPLVVAGTMAAWHAINPCAFVCTEGGTYTFGAMSFLVTAWPIWPALAGLWLVLEAIRNPNDPCSQAGLLVSAAFVFNGILDGMVLFLTPVDQGWGAYFDGYGENFLALVMPLLVIPISLLAMALHFVAHPRNPNYATRMRQLVGFSLLAAAAGSLPVYGGFQQLQVFVFTAFRILIPAMMAFALVRHRLFGIEVRLRWTISKTTLGAIFIAVFFTVSEIASEYFGDAAGNQYYGIIAASLLVFLWVPLQNLAERFAHSLLPEENPDKLKLNRREEMFLRQAKLVWADGNMGVKERQILDQLRLDLDLDLSNAAKLEQDAFLSHGGPRKRLSRSVS